MAAFALPAQALGHSIAPGGGARGVEVPSAVKRAGQRGDLWIARGLHLQERPQGLRAGRRAVHSRQTCSERLAVIGVLDQRQ